MKRNSFIKSLIGLFLAPKIVSEINLDKKVGWLQSINKKELTERALNTKWQVSFMDNDGNAQRIERGYFIRQSDNTVKFIPQT